jgi:hypothetical protein
LAQDKVMTWLKTKPAGPVLFVENNAFCWPGEERWADIHGKRIQDSEMSNLPVDYLEQVTDPSVLGFISFNEEIIQF